MSQRVSIIGHSGAVGAKPSWRDYELQAFEKFFLNEGVLVQGGTELKVQQHAAGANMQVDVQIGDAIIEITNTNLTPNKTYKVYFNNDAVEELTIGAADGTHPRIDRVIAKVRVDVNPDSSAENVAVLEVLQGTPAASPSAPAEPSNAITLALVSVPASDTTIATAQITDSRPYCSMITTVLLDLIRTADLASTSANKGASLVGVRDADGHFVGTTVEAVLAELFSTQGGAGFFGDGNDGDATLDGSTDYNGFSSRSGSTYTLTRDIFMENLTINTGVTLNPAGYRIFVASILTLTGTGKIQTTGNTGGNGSTSSSGTGAAGGAAGAAPAAGYFPAPKAGVIGGAGGNGRSGTGGAGVGGSPGTNGTAAANAVGSNGAAGAAGGRGGDGNSGSGDNGGAAGAAGAAGVATASTGGIRALPHLIDWITVNGGTILQPSTNAGAGSGGGGGGGGVGASGSNGGGGGGGGGSGSDAHNVLVAAHTIVGTGSIRSVGGLGGDGGNGANGNSLAQATGGGGGGAPGSGGGGGAVTVLSKDRTGYSGTVESVGGAAGSVGTAGTSGSGAVGTGPANGAAGSTGVAGPKFEFTI